MPLKTMMIKLLSDDDKQRLTNQGLSQYRDLLILPSPLVQELHADANAEESDASAAPQADVTKDEKDGQDDVWPESMFATEVIDVPPKAVDSSWLWEHHELRPGLEPGAVTSALNGSRAAFPFPTIKVYDLDAVASTLKGADGTLADKDERLSCKARLEVMHEIGGIRRLAQCNPRSAFRLLNIMERDFPNFAEVTTYLRGELALALADHAVVRPCPILLDGPPGCGKTEYARRIAGIFGIQNANFHIVNVATMQSSASLCGTSNHYSNTKTGLIFNEIVGSPYANPVILLDEIDKAKGDERFSPSSILYGLLSESAQRFSDECMPSVPIDASRITWFMTSNYADTIEPALLSRVMRFNIAMPTLAQSRVIVSNIFREMHGAVPALYKLTLSEGAKDRLIELSPRKMRETIKLAAGQALVAERSTIEARDIPKLKMKQSIGF
jgi:ATP-dependent Lon protease